MTWKDFEQGTINAVEMVLEHFFRVIMLKFYVNLHSPIGKMLIYLFIWGFYVAFNTVQVISRRVVGRAEETIHTVR